MLLFAQIPALKKRDLPPPPTPILILTLEGSGTIVLKVLYADEVVNANISGPECSLKRPDLAIFAGFRPIRRMGESARRFPSYAVL